MAVWINFDFLGVGETISPDEVDMLRKRTKIDQYTSDKIIQAGPELRRQYKAGDLPYRPSLGDLINWVTLVKDGNTPMEAAEETIIGLTSDNVEVQADVRRILRQCLINRNNLGVIAFWDLSITPGLFQYKKMIQK